MLRALAFLLVLTSASASAQAALTFVTERHDFGTLAEGPSATHTFVFTNTGNQPLTLDAVEPACGCTAPSFSRGPVAPGEQGTIVVAYDSQNRPGPFDKTIAVTANAAQPQQVVLRVVGEVVPGFAADGVQQGALVFSTDRADLGTFASEAYPQHGFRMYNTGARPLRVREARVTHADGRPAEGVTVVAPSMPVFGKDVAGVIVRVEDAALAAPGGALDLTVHLDTDDAEVPAKTLRLVGRVEG